MFYLILILVYSALQIALGVYIGRRVRGTKDFFVAGRALGPGLLFATLLASNIGAGSTVGAAAAAYADGLGAVWWVGAAAIGQIVLAFWVGPRIRQIAATHDLRTVGDFLEWRYDSRVRAAITALLWVGSIAILAGQLLGLAAVLNVIIGLPVAIGCIGGGVVITAYFSAGGLKSSAAVNVVQLSVKLFGFALALPILLHGVGGLGGLHLRLNEPGYWNIWGNGASGWWYLAMLGPAFVVSPGILQKVYAARDDRAVRLGVGLNALGLAAFAIVPVLLGMIARLQHPDLENLNTALPLLLATNLPPLIGGLAIAALFSAEVSAADAVLFMLTTSLTQDLYRRFVNPAASEQRLMTVARATALGAGAIGIAMALVSATIIGVLSIFYTLLGVSLFVPMIAGLYRRRAGTPEALAAIGAGVSVVIAAQFATGGKGLAGWTPAMLGLACAFAAWLIVTLIRPARVIGPTGPTGTTGQTGQTGEVEQ